MKGRHGTSGIHIPTLVNSPQYLSNTRCTVFMASFTLRGPDIRQLKNRRYFNSFTRTNVSTMSRAFLHLWLSTKTQTGKKGHVGPHQKSRSWQKRVRVRGGGERCKREYPQLEPGYLGYETFSPPLISTPFFCPFPTFRGSVREQFDPFAVATSQESSNACAKESDFMLMVELFSLEEITIDEDATEINWI